MATESYAIDEYYPRMVFELTHFCFSRDIWDALVAVDDIESRSASRNA
jgi:hypothetical protein